MHRISKWTIGSGLTLLAGSAAAQDLAPALDPSTIAQGQVIAGTARGYAERGGYRERNSRTPSDAETAQTCRNARSMIRRGDPNSGLRKLVAICRSGGY